MMKSKLNKRILSAILCLAMLLPYIPGFNLIPAVSAASVSGMDPVTSSEVKFMDGIYYEIARTTRYNGNRTYTVQVDLSANLTHYDHARIRTASQNGYVTIEETGYYLLELWGGKGADGGIGLTGAILIPLPTPGGNGGAGGYVYGKVFLEEGQTLAFNIGTNGTKSTVYNDGSGGVNGDGGTHGEEGSYTVGAGGGYTAIYLFEKGEFDPSYVSEKTFNIPETARLNRHLMIAGGGGGGGAGLGGTLPTLADNGSPPSAPSGGAAGNINRGVSMTLTGDGYDVPGYVFSGRNGLSSGTDSSWVGRGGSNVPGAIPSTLMGVYDATRLPNDWTGTYYNSSAPGAGGSGNFRGGGGGSGYAGGSGGLMKAQLLASHIGGGGGGSSFIAEEVNGKKIEFLDLTDEEKQYLSGAANQPVGAATGGAVQISYLKSAEDAFYEEMLDHVTLTGSVSKYFEIVESSCSVKETGTLSVNTLSDGSSTFTVSDLSIRPVRPNSAGKTARVTLRLRAKSEFMGGNSVPFVSGIQASFLSPNDKTTPLTFAPVAEIQHHTVNVPLLEKMQTKSYTSSTEGKSYATSSLYVDDYTTPALTADHRNNLSSYWYYDFVSAISTYSVWQYNKQSDTYTQVTSSTVAPTETTQYEVRYTVTPKNAADDAVKVGPAVANPHTVKGKAVISVVAPGVSVLNGLTVSGAKSLNYQSDKYVFSTLINQESQSVTIGGESSIINISGETSWSAPEDGWYCVQAWGGNGGSGGRAVLDWYYTYKPLLGSEKIADGEDYASGGAGGAGGTVKTYIYLQKGETLQLSIGTQGSSASAGITSCGTKNTWYRASSTGGYGGNPTTVKYGDDTLIIAGGGGGGGGAGIIGKTKELSAGLEYDEYGRGTSGNTSTTIGTSLTATFTGGRGGSGSATGSSIWNSNASGGSGGSAGANYKNNAYGTSQRGEVLSVVAQKYADEINITKSVSNGQVAITLLQNDKMEMEMDTVKGIQTQVAFSRYFDVEGVQLDVGSAYNSASTITNADGSKTTTYTSNTYGQIAKFTYKIETAPDGISSLITVYDCDYALVSEIKTTDSGQEMVYTAALNFSYTLTPKDGFLGGNDVPVLAYGQTGNQPDTHDGYADYGVKITQGDEFMNLLASDPTDYANVENTVDLSQYLTVRDKTVRLGDTVNKSDLYTFTPPVYGADAWEDDFVTFKAPEERTWQPTATEEVPVTVSFAPITDPAEKATIVESVVPQEFTLDATVYVEVPVTNTLTNLTSDHADWTLWGEDFACNITAKDGYILPEEITVTIGGDETENYTYNSSLGTLAIEGQYVTGPIVIDGKADVKTYDIHFVYAEFDAEAGEQIRTKVYTGIVADTVIDWSDIDAIAAAVPEKEGYTYVLSYDVDGGLRPETMPANNLWVYGSYTKAEYLLEIEYVYADGTQAAEPYKNYVVFGDEYNVPSPAAKKGYLPDKTVISGVMGTTAVKETVTYHPSVNTLLILHQKADGSLLKSESHQMVTDQEYSIAVEKIEGYTPDRETVTGKMQGNESETVVVIHTPEQYTVTFDYKSGEYADATMDGEPRLVEYGRNYGYNATEKLHDGLPTPQLAGYTFVGWYKEAALENQVKDTDLVEIGDRTFYAKWERTKFKLTIRYEFLYEDGDYLPTKPDSEEFFESKDAVQAHLTDDVVEIPFGEAYSVDLPALTGYSSYRNFGLNDQEKLTALTGTMPGQNRLVIISFEINTYEIKFADLPGQHVTYSDGDTSTDDVDSFETLWQTVYVKHNVAPVYTGDEPAHDTRAQYTYAFTGWYGSNDSKDYPGVSPEFPKATGERNYYATYTATENIISVSHGTTVKYFTEVAPALEYAETNIASTVTMTFRRNNGNEPVLNLDGDTLTFGNTYTGTTSYPLTVDLNGITLQTTGGESVVKNTVSPIRLTLRDSGTGGEISASGDGNVVAIDCATALTVNNAISVTARSANGNATALHSGDTVTLGDAVILAADAENGLAIGLDVTESATVNAAKISADGKEAIGIRVADGASVTLTGSVLQMNVNGADSAKGIALPSGASLVNTVLNTNEQKITASGDAYGIYNEGTLSSVNLKMTVEAGENAYGLYNNAGTVTTAGIGEGTDLRATGKEGYGLYNAENGTAIGSADGDKLSKGAFAGSSYGIYSADDSIYASGNFVYFKGADEESALLGVVHAPYDQVDATTQFEAGYYRLAAMRTLEFVTNGGTEIKTVKQYYDTPLDPVETKRSGYTFVDWHKTEPLDSVYKLPATMPDEDLTLYAQWNLNQYQYALDIQFKEVTVKFYKTDPTAPTDISKMTLIHEQKLTMNDNILNVPSEELTYANGSTLYIHSGWYNGVSTSQDDYIVLNGDIAQYADENGELILYSGWQTLSTMQSYVELGTSSVGCTVDASYSSYYYMYFVVPADGNYTLYYRNNGSSSSTGRRRYITVTKYYNSNGTKYSTSLKSRGYVSVSSSYSTLSMSSLKAGDVIVLRAERYSSSYTGSSYDTTVYAYVTSTSVDLSAVDNYVASSEVKINPIDYNVEMGTVQLPIKEADAEHEDMKFAGWADTENAPKEDRILQITPDMVDTVEEWQNGQLWQLYSQWTERIWDAYQSGKRDFTVFESTSSVSIRANGTVSLRFKSEQSSDEPVRFVFEKGLPAGTLLTLIDRSAAVPVYYTYTVTGTVKELASTDFLRMGASAISFSGIGSDLVLQICYQNAAASAGSEKVSIYAGDIVPEVDADYSVTNLVSLNVSNGSHSFPYTDQHTLSVTIPSATGLGLPDDYKVFLRVRWDGVNLAPGTEIKLGDVPAVIYNGDYAMLDTGLTVADMTSSTTAQVHIYMPTMVQNEFADKTFYYELCIAPDTSAAFGKQVEAVLTVTEVLSLQETPSLTVDAVEKTAAVGEEISVTVNSADAEFYLVQQNGDGTFQSNANCSALFNALTVASDGKLSLADSDLVTDGVFTATLSANAPVGKYYLLVKLGDKYERILLKVTAA